MGLVKKIEEILPLTAMVTFCFWAALYSLWDLSSLTRDRSGALAVKAVLITGLPENSCGRVFHSGLIY